ncbi:MAG: CHASE domain-containing protein [Clostridia bacterium]|nr:CHASE domain-containing protein [Clostridia bacterium]
MQIKLKRKILVIFIFIFIFSLFCIIAFFENRENISDYKKIVKHDEDLLIERINTLLNFSIGSAEGVVSFVRTYPNLNQEDFSNYVSKVLDNNNLIVSHMVAIKDTTIAFSYPLEGNESGIGIDLTAVDDQRDEILKVKNENMSMLVGPVNLVEGGIRLINRIPIFIDPMDASTYWGQLSVIIRYEELLNNAGIVDLDELYHIRIEQINEDQTKGLIYENHSIFTDDRIESIVNVPNGKWIITLEPIHGFHEKSMTFYLFLVLGFVFSLGLSGMVRYILKINENLNEKVEIRTEHLKNANIQLEESLDVLKTTQFQLVEKEKHAALGSLVAGVAHEINTPLGICVTANSFLNSLSSTLLEDLESGQLKKSKLIESLNRINDSTNIIDHNLTRTNNLITSFKQLSVDQHLEEKRIIDVQEYFEYIIHTVQPTYDAGNHTIHLNVIENKRIITFPGALAQVLTNLLINSLTHGFNETIEGTVNIDVSIHDQTLFVDYYDNGSGIESEIADKIFNPFFTTKRELGNTGLGMHIIFNIVTQQLQGTIQLIHDQEKGVHFQIEVPIS